jgi:hypothetical protein
MKLGNVANVQAWKAGQAPPPGTYTARIDDAEEGKSSGGHPQFKIEWTVVGGQYDGASLTEYLVVPQTGQGHEIGLSKLVALADAIGIDRSGQDFELEAPMLVGRSAQIVCIGEPGFKDPTKTYTKVAGHRKALDEPAATNGHHADDDKPLPF